MAESNHRAFIKQKQMTLIMILAGSLFQCDSMASEVYPLDYAKDIILVEVAYNCERAEYRNKPAPFPETPEGQQQFLDEVHRIILNTPHNRGKGIFWWESATRRGGRRTLFDQDGDALPAITVFDRFTRH